MEQGMTRFIEYCMLMHKQTIQYGVAYNTIIKPIKLYTYSGKLQFIKQIYSKRMQKKKLIFFNINKSKPEEFETDLFKLQPINNQMQVQTIHL